MSYPLRIRLAQLELVLCLVGNGLDGPSSWIQLASSAEIQDDVNVVVVALKLDFGQVMTLKHCQGSECLCVCVCVPVAFGLHFLT